MKLCATAMAWSFLATAVLAQASPVRDETRLFSEEQRVKLDAQLEEMHRQHGVRVLVGAVTFSSDATIRDTASRLVAQWLGDEAGVVLAYDRGKAQSALVVSAGFWQRYPADEVVTLLNEAGGLLLQGGDFPVDKLFAVVALVSKSLTPMESRRTARLQTLTREDLQLALVLGGALVCLLLIALPVARWARERQLAHAQKHYFPDVEVGTRLGAPFGGGTVAERKCGES